jgi:hypothetical protein
VRVWPLESPSGLCSLRTCLEAKRSRDCKLPCSPWDRRSRPTRSGGSRRPQDDATASQPDSSLRALGAAGIVAAALIDSPALLFAALFIYGSETATNLQARYAGTDLAPPRRRATAVSIAMVATTLGAVAGPNAVEATGRVAQALNISVLAGPFLLAAGVTLLLAGLVAALAPGDSLGLLTLALA